MNPIELTPAILLLIWEMIMGTLTMPWQGTNPFQGNHRNQSHTIQRLR